MNKTILIVDDNPDVRFGVKVGLENHVEKINLIEIENGKKCIEYLESNPNPDLILLDIMMPEMDGWEVASRIKDNPVWKNIPIFFLTAKNDPYSESFGKLVSSKYISKPFDLNELIKSIDGLIG